jgi:type IV pilus assembly protein PilA
MLQKGFTLIELMIVVAIIGILAAVAVPAYQDYIARAQMSEAVRLMGSSKTPLSEYFADKGTWPSLAEDVMANTTGKYTKSITISAADASAKTLTLEVLMKDADVNSSIKSRTMILSTRNGGKEWGCGSGGTTGDGPVDPRYLPPACRQ